MPETQESKTTFPTENDLLRQPFSMRQMIAVPANQSRVAGVGEKKWRRRRFNVAAAKYHAGFANHERTWSNNFLF
jgi:hypothetical protein